MSDDTLQLHRDLAARLGAACARKRADYYGRIAESYELMAKDAFAVAGVYAERVLSVEDDGEECDD